MPQRTEFGRLIRKGLMQKGWTQRQLAQEIGLHEDTISGWMTGKFPPSSASFAKLHRSLPIPFDQLHNARINSSFRSESPENVPYRIASWTDVQNWQWDAKRLLSRLIEIDNLLIRHPDYKDYHEGSVEQWAPVFSLYPETWRLLTYRGKNINIIGYWHFVALNKDYYEAFLSGNLVDSMILPIRNPQAYPCTIPR